ncbi:MAG: molybdenum cofactor biosynthesis protein MoaE [Chthoniobacterales bacterium]|nr:molybdenum cofactor biosynthesis protein MoaE [Chthoniobacterales bacterium]
MATPVCEVLLTDLPLVVPAEQALVETGAVLDFWGVVRLTEEQAEIAGIEYEAHYRMAAHQLRVLAEEAMQMFQLQQISIRHRLGFVPVGEPSLLVRVGSRHRAAAFEASEWIVVALKQRVPIWKHPHGAAQLSGAAKISTSTFPRARSLSEV